MKPTTIPMTKTMGVVTAMKSLKMGLNLRVILVPMTTLKTLILPTLQTHLILVKALPVKTLMVLIPKIAMTAKNLKALTLEAMTLLPVKKLEKKQMVNLLILKIQIVTTGSRQKMVLKKGLNRKKMAE